MNYVKVNGKKVAIDQKTLYLESFKLNKISDIKRLNKNSDLQGLYLEKNKIHKIERLNHLNNLRKLHLEANFISEI